MAVEKGELHKVEDLLNRGMDPNTTDSSGHTMLMKAARLGHADVVMLLLARKASVARQTPSGDTALMHACLGGSLGIVRMLIDAGAAVNRRG
ncbi:MAG: ankyrin repeat domain-containing protein, partial [Betaproteobacteria bacterium]